MMLDLSKPVQTRDGRKVEILKTDLIASEYPIIAVVTSFSGKEFMHEYLPDGKLMINVNLHKADLINIPKPKKKKKVIGWVNVYYAMGVTSQCLHLSKGESDKAIKLNMDGYITTVKVKVDSDKLK